MLSFLSHESKKKVLPKEYQPTLDYNPLSYLITLHKLKCLILHSITKSTVFISKCNFSFNIELSNRYRFINLMNLAIKLNKHYVWLHEINEVSFKCWPLNGYWVTISMIAICSAICGRIEAYISSLPPPYQLQRPLLARAASTEARTPARAPSFSVCWASTSPVWYYN